MKIESIIRRPNGTEVVLDRRKYVFRPEDGDFAVSPHVCEVTDPNHISALLRIPEGYRAFSGNPEDEDGNPIIPVVSAPASIPGILSPIELSDLEDEEMDAEAASDREEYRAAIAAEAAEAAEAMARMNNAGLPTIPGPAAEADDPAYPVDEDADEAPSLPAETVASEPDVKMTAAYLSTLDAEELAEVYEVKIGKAPRAGMKSATMIKAILATE